MTVFSTIFHFFYTNSHFSPQPSSTQNTPKFDRKYPQDHFWTPTPLRPFFEPTILNIKFKFSEAAIIKLGIAPKNTIGQQIKASTLKIEANLVSQQELLSGRLNKFYSQYWGNQGILGYFGNLGVLGYFGNLGNLEILPCFFCHLFTEFSFYWILSHWLRYLWNFI